jgi:hypothetical protein
MIDVLSVERTLYIEGKHHYKNKYAGFLSIILAVTLIVVSYYLSIDYIYNLTPIIQEHSVAFIEGWENQNLHIMFAYPKTLLSKTTLWDLGFTSNQYTPLQDFRECADVEYSGFTSETKNDTLIYYCKNLTDTTRYRFFLFDCKDRIKYLGEKIPTCTEDAKSLLYMKLYVTAYKLDNLKVRDPIYKITKNLTMVPGLNTGNFHYKAVQLENDVGLFFPDIYRYLYLSFYLPAVQPDDRVGALDINFTSFTNQKKYYMKLQEHLKNTIPIIFMLYKLAVIFYSKINNYLYLRYLLKCLMDHNYDDLVDRYVHERKKGNFFVYFSVKD